VQWLWCLTHAYYGQHSPIWLILKLALVFLCFWKGNHLVYNNWEFQMYGIIVELLAHVAQFKLALCQINNIISDLLNSIYRAVLLKWELRFCSSQTAQRIFKCFSHQLDFFHLVVGLFVPFYKIPQFIAQIWWICPFSSTSLPDLIFFINLRVGAEAAAAHLCPCCHSSLLPSEETKWRSKKGPKSLNQRD